MRKTIRDTGECSRGSRKEMGTPGLGVEYCGCNVNVGKYPQASFP